MVEGGHEEQPTYDGIYEYDSIRPTVPQQSPAARASNVAEVSFASLVILPAYFTSLNSAAA